MDQEAEQLSIEKIKAEVLQAMSAYNQSLGKCTAVEIDLLEQILLEKISILSAYAQLVTGSAGTVQ